MSSIQATARAARLVSQLVPAAPTTCCSAASTPACMHANATNALASTPRKLIRQEVRGRVGVIYLSRPKAMNALNDELMAEVGSAIMEYEASGVIGCIVITGDGKAFAAGADIKEMAGKSYYEMSTKDKIAPWEVISRCKIPVIAAVNGVALGGGCEIAMMCDIIYASENAKFGQPEIKIGTIPGAGGTQRLTKAIGKSKAMEMVLTGNMMSAHDMEKAGLVSRVLPADQLLPSTFQLADQIASLSLPIVKTAKRAVLSSFDSSLSTGMGIERALFHATFALEDQTEGMAAFVGKRKPQWKHQ